MSMQFLHACLQNCDVNSLSVAIFLLKRYCLSSLGQMLNVKYQTVGGNIKPKICLCTDSVINLQSSFNTAKQHTHHT